MPTPSSGHGTHHQSFCEFQFRVSTMRLIMLGTGPFAVPTLAKLAESRHEVALVITRPPTDRKATASPMQQKGEALGLEVWAPATVNVAESQARISALKPDL